MEREDNGEMSTPVLTYLWFQGLWLSEGKPHFNRGIDRLLYVFKIILFSTKLLDFSSQEPSPHEFNYTSSITRFKPGIVYT